MNRFKKEIRKCGVMLESDYPFMPYNGTETVKVCAEKATVSTYHVSAGWTHIKFRADMSFIVWHK